MAVTAELSGKNEDGDEYRPERDHGRKAELAGG
jgi:hypothetical protein